MGSMRWFGRFWWIFENVVLDGFIDDVGDFVVEVRLRRTFARLLEVNWVATLVTVLGTVWNDAWSVWFLITFGAQFSVVAVMADFTVIPCGRA